MRSVAAALMAGAAAANPNQFESTAPGGDTKCFKGGDFAFMHRTGTVNKIVFEMEGGGACWNALTCGVGACTESVDVQGELKMLNGDNSGLHDGKNAKNAFAEWHHVYIPYCSCDIHSGRNDIKYLANTVHHYGHVNVMAALQWAQTNFPTKPDAVAVTGCSAGSAGAWINWPTIAGMYPSAQHYVFGDSYIGVFAEGQWNKGFANWGVNLPTNVPGVSPDTMGKWFDGISCYAQEKGVEAFPKAQVGFYTSNADAVQSSFLALGGGSGFTKQMRTLAKCYNNNTQIHTFIAQGDAHCRSQDDGYYSVVADGTNLAEWVGSLVGGARDLPSPDCANDGSCSADAAAAPADLTALNAGYRARS